MRALPPLLICFALAAAALSAVPFRLALTVAAAERGDILFAAPVLPGDTFDIRFIHSVHRTPVEERYIIGDRREIVLTGVVYESYGVGNPSGPEPGQRFRLTDGKYEITGIDRRLPEIRLRIGQKVAGHTLTIGGRTMPFAAWSEPGSAVRLKVERISLWKLWTLCRGGSHHAE